jgi:Glycosyl hydrolase family 3 N terminal domain
VIVAIDHEGGAVQRLVEAHGCARLPSARQVAVDHTVAEAQAVYAEAGRAVARLGFNLNLAPVVDLDNAGNPAIGHYGRAFSHDADTVTAHAGHSSGDSRRAASAVFSSISRVRAARKATVTSGRPIFRRSGPKPTSRHSGASPAQAASMRLFGSQNRRLRSIPR